MTRPLGVACFEAPWVTDMRNRLSVLPVLELLQRLGTIRFFHRTIGTRAQLNKDLLAWATQARYSSYEVAFIATHGVPGSILIGRDKVSLVDLAEQLDGRLSRRIVYFGACASADDDVPDIRSRAPFESTLRKFKARTKARAVCGYANDVDWDESAAFELLLLSCLDQYSGRLYAFKRLRQDYPDLCEILGFVSTQDEARRKPPRKAPLVQDLLTRGDELGIGPPMRTLYKVAIQLGLGVRPWASSIMFTPPANRSRCLFTIWPRNGSGNFWAGAEVFSEFYPSVTIRQAESVLGPQGWRELNQKSAQSYATGLRKLIRKRPSG